MISVGLCIVALLPLSALSQSIEECQTPNNTTGSCINIKECPPLLEMLLNRRNDSSVKQFLRSSSCRNASKEAFVCCPKVSQEGEVKDRNSNTFQRLLAPPDCGLPSNRDRSKIQGGVPAEQGAWPWAVALGYTRKNSTGEVTFHCGGSLVSNSYVLTAGHCVDTSTHDLKSVRLGEVNLTSTNGTIVEVEKIIRHPDYTAFRNDIALLKLKAPIQPSDSIKPVCLPKVSQLRSKTFERTSPFIIGWGAVSWGGPKSSVLMQAQVPVVDNKSCGERYTEISKSAVITKGHICAGFKSGKSDTCTGDSGGPMMVPEGQHYYVIGVVSYGIKCGEPNTPAVYTRVSEYIEWINGIIE